MILPNQIMMEMLGGVIMFDCSTCKRYWTLREFTEHKAKGFCIKDPEAKNNIG